MLHQLVVAIGGGAGRGRRLAVGRRRADLGRRLLAGITLSARSRLALSARRTGGGGGQAGGAPIGSLSVADGRPSARTLRKTAVIDSEFCRSASGATGWGRTHQEHRTHRRAVERQLLVVGEFVEPHSASENCRLSSPEISLEAYFSRKIRQARRLCHKYTDDLRHMAKVASTSK